MAKVEGTGNITFTEPYVILGEGKDEVCFFKSFVKHMGVGNVQILDYEGKTQLNDKIGSIFNTPGFRNNVISLGITRDADMDAKAAFQSICGALKRVGSPAPSKSLIPVGSNPKVTVMILPGRGQKGMLEDMCLKSVEKDPAISCVENFFHCVKTSNKNLPTNMSKARTHAFLASREKSDLRLGEAAEKGYWNFDHPVFNELKKFIRMVIS